MHVDLDLLRVLEAVVRLRSVTAAGREIGLSQSATSHALSRLRSAFGEDLLLRTPSGMLATPRAEHLAERARTILADVTKLVEPPTKFDPATARRTFAIAMTDGGQLLLLPALLELLAHEAPGITLDVRPPSMEDAKHLATGELALRVGGVLEGSHLYRQVFFEDRIVWVTGSARGRKPRKLSLADVVARGRVKMVGRSGGDDDLQRALEAAKLPPPPTVLVQNVLAGLMVVMRSDRIFTLTNETAHAVAAVLPVRASEPAIPYAPVPIGQHWHARMDADPGHVWLRQHIKSLASRKAWRSKPSRDS